MKRLYCCIAVLAVLGVQTVLAQELVQGPYGPSGTWNIYEQGNDLLTWAEALKVARSKTREGVPGELVSIHSLEENQVVADLALNQVVWIGATDREGTAPLLNQNGHLSPQESIELELGEFVGAENVEAAKLAGWAWTSGDAFCFQNWAGGEPNNWDGTAAAPADTGREDATFIRADGLWNDAPGGYEENEPVPPTLQPGSSTQEVVDGAEIRMYDYVIEYRTNSPTPFPGIEQVGETPVLEPGCGPNVNPGPMPGDFNKNGSLDLPDVNDLTTKIVGGTNPKDYDLNADSKVDGTDLNVWVKTLRKTWFGDADLNGEFNSADFVKVFTAGKYELNSDAGWDDGDWNGDRRFNSSDFVSAFTDGGYEKGPLAAAAVPEPATGVLLGLGGLMLFILRRRNQT